MAAPLHITSSLLLLLSAPALIAGESLIEKACGNGKSGADQCKACLNKSPNSAGSELKGLASNMLDCCIASAADARDSAVDLSHNKGGVLGACAEDFAQANINLGRARTFVRSGNFGAASPSVGTCADRYRDCVSRIGNENDVPKELLSMMKKLKGECDAAAGIISNLAS